MGTDSTKSSQLLRLIPEYFQENPRNSSDLINFLSESVKYEKLGFYDKFGFPFFQYNDACQYFLKDLSNLDFLGLDIKIDVSNNNSDLQALKEIMRTWILAKAPEKRNYFAKIIVDNIARIDNSEHIGSRLIAGIIFIYDTDYASYDKAVESLHKVISLAENRLDGISRTRAKYFANIFLGFASLKFDNVFVAKNYFQIARDLFTNDVTANFYICYSDIISGNGGKLNELIDFAINYDVEILKFCINNYSTEMYKFAISNAVTYNIFYHEKLSVYYDQIVELLKKSFTENIGMIESLRDYIENFEKLKIKALYGIKTNSILYFIKKFYQDYKDSFNLLVCISSKTFVSLFLEIREEIISNVKKTIMNKVSGKVFHYDSQIDKTRNMLDEWKEVQVQELGKIKNDKQIEIAKTERFIENQIYDFENKIENIENIPKYNPGNVFTSSFSYSLIFSLLVFLSINLYECSSRSGALSLGQGARWGGIAFILGFIFSLLLAGFSVLDRIIEKKSLASKLAALKRNRNQIIDKVAGSYDIHYNKIKKENKEKIDKLINDIKKYEDEKEKIYKEAFEQHQKSIDSIKESINKVFGI